MFVIGCYCIPFGNKSSSNDVIDNQFDLWRHKENKEILDFNLFKKTLIYYVAKFEHKVIKLISFNFEYLIIISEYNENEFPWVNTVVFVTFVLIKFLAVDIIKVLLTNMKYFRLKHFKDLLLGRSNKIILLCVLETLRYFACKFILINSFFKSFN